MKNSARRLICSCAPELALFCLVAALLGGEPWPARAADRMVLCEEFTNFW